MNLKKYTIIFSSFTVIATVLLALTNFMIDPYMLYQEERVEGINERVPTAANRSTLYKPYHIEKVKPETIIVGNSRPEMGINPKSVCWPESKGTVYNLTFPGQGTYGHVRGLYHAVASGKVKDIYLGVDFVDFLYRRSPEEEYWPKVDSEFSSRLLVDEEFNNNKTHALIKLRDYATTLFSLDSLKDSIYTLLSQSSPSTADRTSLGFNPAYEYLEVIQYEGAQILFEQKLIDMEKRFADKEMSIYTPQQQWSMEFEAVKRAIALAIQNDIQLTIFINPYHHTYLDTIRRAGYWQQFEEFKRGLVHTVTKYGQDKVTIWDFSLYSMYTVSPQPSPGLRSKESGWFWEPAHYKQELGEVMLSEMLGQACVDEYPTKEPVGKKLDQLNINLHLQQQNKRGEIALQSRKERHESS